MGDAVSRDSYTPKQRTRYRQLLLDDLESFDRHLQEAEFVDHGTCLLYTSDAADDTVPV